MECPLLVCIWQSEFRSSSMLIDDDNITIAAWSLKSVSHFVFCVCMYRCYSAFRFARFYENCVNCKHNFSGKCRCSKAQWDVNCWGMWHSDLLVRATTVYRIIRLFVSAFRHVSRAVWRSKLENQTRGVRRVRTCTCFMAVFNRLRVKTG